MRKLVVGGLVAANLFMIYQIGQTLTKTPQVETVIQENTYDEFQMKNFNIDNIIIEEEYIVENLMPEHDIPLDRKWQELIWDLSQEYELSYELAIAVVKLESNFNHNVINRNNNLSIDMGLFQINSQYKSWYGELAGIHTNFDPYDIEQNIRAGMAGLNYYRNHWRNLGYSEEDVFTNTLLSYNRGIAGATSYLKRYDGNRNKYVEIVSRHKSNLERTGGLK